MQLTVPPSDAFAVRHAATPADRGGVNRLLNALSLSSCTVDDLGNTPELHLQAVSTLCGAELMPRLLEAIDRASGWVLHRQMMSASTLQMRLETQGRALMDLYASLLEQGLELSRDSHRMLTERCTCTYLQQARGSIVSMVLDVTWPTDLQMLGKWWSVQTD